MYKKAQRYLETYLICKGETERIQKTLEKMNEDIGVSGINYDGMPKGSKITSKTENDAIELAEKSMELYRAKTRANRTMLDIEMTIEAIGSSVISDILWYRYIDDREWSYIEAKLHYSESHTMRLHNKGLEAVSRIIEGEAYEEINEQTGD